MADKGVVMEAHGIKRLLLGIDVSISALLLAVTSSGMEGIVLVIGLIGFLICASAMAARSRS